MFRSSERVATNEHRNWLASTLDNDDICLLVCISDSSSRVAVVRFDIQENEAELSINLAPSQRGKGIAKMCLSAAIDFFSESHPHIAKLVAEIKVANMPSRRTFEGLGFVLQIETKEYLHFTKSL